MSRYQTLKDRAHKQVCEWMRCLDWEETANADQLRSCALSWFRGRHQKQPRFKRATKAYNQRQVVTRPKESRLMAIEFLARAEIQETNALL